MTVRNCGDCIACCIHAGIAELDKRPGVPCKHLKSPPEKPEADGSHYRAVGSDNCTCYPTRPDDCKVYECLWLRGMGSDEDRPDKLGIIFDRQPAIDNSVMAKLLIPGQETDAETIKLLKIWSRRLGKPLVVVACTNRNICRIIGRASA